MTVSNRVSTIVRRAFWFHAVRFLLFFSPSATTVPVCACHFLPGIFSSRRSTHYAPYLHTGTAEATTRYTLQGPDCRYHQRPNRLGRRAFLLCWIGQPPRANHTRRERFPRCVCVFMSNLPPVVLCGEPFSRRDRPHFVERDQNMIRSVVKRTLARHRHGSNVAADS